MSSFINKWGWGQYVFVLSVRLCARACPGIGISDQLAVEFELVHATGEPWFVLLRRR